MNENYEHSMDSGLAPATGMTLIANPFLKDPHFSRSVIYLCDHSETGSFGFVMNKLFHQTLNELLPDTFEKTHKLYIGGPVQLDTVHFLHQYPDLIAGGLKIKEGIYWGGNFEQLIALMNAGEVDENRVKFFLGYSGWTAGQLKDELKEHSWIISNSNKRLLFKGGTHVEELWKEYLKSMGNDFAPFANYPIDPSLN